MVRNDCLILGMLIERKMKMGFQMTVDGDVTRTKRTHTEKMTNQDVQRFRNNVRPPKWHDGFTGRYTYRNAGLVLNGDERVELYGKPLAILLASLVAIALAVLAILLVDSPEVLDGGVASIAVSIVMFMIVGLFQWRNNMERLREVWDGEEKEKIREANLSTILSSTISKVFHQSLLP